MSKTREPIFWISKTRVWHYLARAQRIYCSVSRILVVFWRDS